MSHTMEEKENEVFMCVFTNDTRLLTEPLFRSGLDYVYFLDDDDDDDDHGGTRHQNFIFIPH